MQPLSQRQKERLERALNLTLGGPNAVIEYILALTEEIIELKNRKIPPPEKGDPGDKGDSYILTDADKAEIASKITVPVVEKVIEKTTEVIVEKPIVKTEIVKETIEKQPIIQETHTTIEHPVTGQEVASKLNEMFNVIDPKIIKGWADLERLVKENIRPPKDFDVRIGVSKTEMRALENRVATLESNPGGSFSKLVPTGTVDGSNKAFTFTSAPSIIVRDGIPMQATQSDGFVNWTGTTSVTLTIAPNFDIFGY